MKRRRFLITAGVSASAMFASPQAGDSTFEVASIKPVAPDAPRTGGRTGPGDTHMFAVRHITLKALILMAYEIPEEQLSGGPGWVQSDLFDVDAKPSKPTPREQMLRMLRGLLADRFQLRVHREKKSVAVSLLTVAKGGPKLGPHFHLVDEPALIKEMEHPDPKSGLFLGGTMKQFASLFYRNMRLFHPPGEWSPGPPLRDQTGLEGLYAIYVQLPGPDEDLVSAVEQQLGLKVENRKLELDMVMIDGAQKPSPN